MLKNCKISFRGTSITNSCFADLSVVTLACEDANSKLVSVANVDVDKSLVQIWKLKFGHKAKHLFRQTERQSTRFGQYFEVKVQARF